MVLIENRENNNVQLFILETADWWLSEWNRIKIGNGDDIILMMVAVWRWSGTENWFTTSKTFPHYNRVFDFTGDRDNCPFLLLSQVDIKWLSSWMSFAIACHQCWNFQLGFHSIPYRLFCSFAGSQQNTKWSRNNGMKWYRYNRRYLPLLISL